MRRFIIAPSMARLIKREKTSRRVVEGYFPTHATRNSHVVIDGQEGRLILSLTDAEGGTSEEVTVVPRRQAEALLDVCVGRIDVERMDLSVAGQSGVLERITRDGRAINIVAVNAGADFVPPTWLGREFGGEASYWNRAFALEGVPAIDVPVSDIAFNALLDELDGRAPILPRQEAAPAREEALVEAAQAVLAPEPAAKPVEPAAQPSGGAQQKERALEGLSAILARMPAPRAKDGSTKLQ